MLLTMPRRSLLPLALLIASSSFQADLRADVMIRERIVSSGYQGLGAGETVSTIILSGSMRRCESRVTPPPARASMKIALEDFDTEIVDIVRLDRGLIWRLRPDARQYSEITFARLREMVDEAAERFDAPVLAPPEESPEVSPEVSDDGLRNYTFSLEIQYPGDSAPINDFETDRTIIRLIGLPGDEEDRKRYGEVTITLDLWVAPDVPGEKEIREFERAYAEAVGAPPQAIFPAPGSPLPFRGGFERLAAEIRKIDGYPIRSILTISSDKEVAGSPQGTTATGLRATTGDAFLSRFAGKHFKKQPVSRVEPAGGFPLLRYTREVLAIQASEIERASFEVPSGFEKTD